MQSVLKKQEIIDAHRHICGPTLRSKMLENDGLDPNKPLPQVNDIDLFFYRDFVDVDYSIKIQEESSVTKALLSQAARSRRLVSAS